MTTHDPEREPVGLVLAGGGARGGYELGALSVLLPALEERGERPTVIVGTSVGAISAAYLAASAHVPAEEVARAGRALWTDIAYDDVLEPVVSPAALARLGRYFGQVLGLRRSRLYSLLDTAPLRETIRRLVAFERVEQNVAERVLHAVAVVADSALTGRSVVFHRGGDPPPRDEKRGIDYVSATLAEEHVLASAALPGFFPAVHIGSPPEARGWYFDGGTRLNTPIKPALEMGARRVVVLAVNSIAPGPDRLAGEQRPDALAAAAHILQAVLVDPLVHDLRTLATVNELPCEETGEPPPGRRRIPYIFVAPAERDAVGEIATRIFNERYRGLGGFRRSRDLTFLGRLVGGGLDPIHGELLSFLFFDRDFARELIELGRRDAERWLAEQHDDGPWQLGVLATAAGAAEAG